MKVTKIIREYVEEQVEKIYRGKMIDTIEMHKELKHKIANIANEYLQQANDNILNALAKENIEVKPFYKEEKLIIGFNLLEYPQVVEQEKINLKLRREKEQKIREILATLELGGTKKDLDDMLAKIAKEVK